MVLNKFTEKPSSLKPNLNEQKVVGNSFKLNYKIL